MFQQNLALELSRLLWIMWLRCLNCHLTKIWYTNSSPPQISFHILLKNQFSTWIARNCHKSLVRVWGNVWNNCNIRESLEKNLLGYLAMGRREAGSVIWLHSSRTTTGNLRSFMHGNGQAAQVTPTTRTFIVMRMLLTTIKQKNILPKELVV